MKLILLRDYKGRKKKKYSYQKFNLDEKKLKLSGVQIHDEQKIKDVLQEGISCFAKDNEVVKLETEVKCGNVPLGNYLYFFRDKYGYIKKLPKSVSDDFMKEKELLDNNIENKDDISKNEEEFSFDKNKYYYIDIELEDQDVLLDYVVYDAIVYESNEPFSKDCLLEADLEDKKYKKIKTKLVPEKSNNIVYEVHSGNWKRIHPNDFICEEWEDGDSLLYKLVMYPSLDSYVYDFSPEPLDCMISEYKYEKWDKDVLDDFFKQCRTNNKYLGKGFFDLSQMKDFDNVVVVNTFLLQAIVNDKEVYEILEMIRNDFDFALDDVEKIKDKESLKKIHEILSKINTLSKYVRSSYQNLQNNQVQFVDNDEKTKTLIKK